jgi:hypothetical protein
MGINYRIKIPSFIQIQTKIWQNTNFFLYLLLYQDKLAERKDIPDGTVFGHCKRCEINTEQQTVKQ